MDICELEQKSQKQSAVSTKRLPLVPADNKNGATRPARTRELTSRYLSPTQTVATGPKHCPSPNASRLSPTSNTKAEKRATSTERKCSSRPSSPSSPSTPIEDTSAETLLASRKIVSNKLPESLWPSTMRSLSVSFQSDTISIPTSKREKPVSHVHSDRTLRLSSNVAHRQAEISTSRKPTPERKRSPLKRNNSANQSENSKPDNSLHPRLTDQHLWPSRMSGKASTALNGGINGVAKTRKPTPTFSSGTSMPSFGRLSLDGTVKPLQKPSSDSLVVISFDDNEEAMSSGCSDDCSSLHMRKPGRSSSSDRTQLAHAAARSLSLLNSGSRPASPLVSRGVSPSRAKALSTSSRAPSPAPSSRGPSSAPSSRGPSPARARPSSPSRQPECSTSVLSFMADIKKGKKAANHIEDVHQLRMLYNRHLQWRYANAQNEAMLRAQKVKAEKVLHCVWKTIADLRESVMDKRINLQQLRLKLNLYLVLNKQLMCLDEWASIERDHHNSLTGTIQDLQSSTIRIPLAGRARGDIETVKAAVCSAVDVVQATGSALASICSRVEEMNSLVSELAEVAARERAMLVQCESILGSSAALQEEECSLRTNLLQRIQGWRSHGQLMY